jgi:fatty acid desaturase
MSPETRAALEKERELRPMALPGVAPQTVSTDAGTSQGAGTPAWVLPLALLAGGFLLTFALTRRG